MMTRVSRTALIALAAMTLAACGNGNDDTGYGEMSLSVTDAPVDSATAVVVSFSGVELKHAGEGEPEVFTFAQPRSIDLLALQGGDSEALFEGEVVPAGDYEWIRLQVNAERGIIDSYIELENGAQHSLWVPSGAQSGLKLVSGFTVPVGGRADFTIDFDLRKSVHDPEGNFTDYILRPALRLIDNTEAGAIAGTVAATLVPAGCEPAVYLYAGSGATPDDVDGTEPEPLSSASVELAADGEYGYELGFVAAGVYTLAFTCDADADAPGSNDDITFSGTQDVTVTANETATANFN